MNQHLGCRAWGSAAWAHPLEYHTRTDPLFDQTLQGDPCARKPPNNLVRQRAWEEACLRAEVSGALLGHLCHPSRFFSLQQSTIVLPKPSRGRKSDTEKMPSDRHAYKIVPDSGHENNASFDLLRACRTMRSAYNTPKPRDARKCCMCKDIVTTPTLRSSVALPSSRRWHKAEPGLHAALPKLAGAPLSFEHLTIGDFGSEPNVLQKSPQGGTRFPGQAVCISEHGPAQGSPDSRDFDKRRAY